MEPTIFTNASGNDSDIEAAIASHECRQEMVKIGKDVNGVHVHWDKRQGNIKIYCLPNKRPQVFARLDNMISRLRDNLDKEEHQRLSGRGKGGGKGKGRGDREIIGIDFNEYQQLQKDKGTLKQMRDECYKNGVKLQLKPLRIELCCVAGRLTRDVKMEKLTKATKYVNVLLTTFLKDWL